MRGKLVSIGKVIREARLKLGFSQPELGRRVGVSRGAVWHWERGTAAPSRDHAPMVAKVLNIPLSLISGDPSWANVAYQGDGTQSRWIPRISWVDAGRGAAAVDPYPVGVGVDYLQVSGEYSDSAFALTVKGQSMEPTFADGDTIVIDPQISPNPGDFVVVELVREGDAEGGGDVTFKQYRPRAATNGHIGPYDLVPLNPEAQTITVNAGNPGRIVGVMVEHRKRYR